MLHYKRGNIQENSGNWLLFQFFLLPGIGSILPLTLWLKLIHFWVNVIIVFWKWFKSMSSSPWGTFEKFEYGIVLTTSYTWKFQLLANRIKGRNNPLFDCIASALKNEEDIINRQIEKNCIDIRYIYIWYERVSMKKWKSE